MKTRFADIQRRLVETPDGCWIWLGQVQTGGYGQVGIDGRRKLVHRLLYERFVGPIPEGMVIDHLCRRRLCARPEHLEVVTNWENLQRGVGVFSVENAAKTHCKRGHEFTPENTRAVKGGRACRACQLIYNARRRAVA